MMALTLQPIQYRFNTSIVSLEYENKPTMLSDIRNKIIHTLWSRYRAQSSQMQAIENGLTTLGCPPIVLDHLAIIDLPGPHSGIPVLRDLFSLIGFTSRGSGYLPDKQNDFHWLAEADCDNQPAHAVLPQVVVADFRLSDMPQAVANIITKYAAHATPVPFDKLRALAATPDDHATSELIHWINHYLTGRDWPLPTQQEFETVHAFNELLAWVLVFGRRPNHFTVSVHLLEKFNDLNAFLRFIESDLMLALNQEGGLIKGNHTTGIMQGSTAGLTHPIALADHPVMLTDGFVEFVWRLPQQPSMHSPPRWNDYFTGFVADHANVVIESLLANR